MAARCAFTTAPLSPSKHLYVSLISSSQHASEFRNQKHYSVFSDLNIFFCLLQEYNATIDFYWSPLLLESNSDNPIIHRVEYRIIRADRIEKHANVWKDADFIVFNSYLWWRKQRDGMTMKVM